MMPSPATDRDAWNAFALAHGGGFLQSWEWGEFQRALGRTVYRYAVGERDDAGAAAEPVAQFLLVMHPLRLGFRYAYVPWGPVLRRGHDVHEQMEMVTVALRKALRRERAVFARTEFPFLASGDAVCKDDLLSLGYLPSRHVQPADTSIVRLHQSEEELLAAMHQKTRYNIRVAERHGVTVRITDASDAAALQRDAALFWSLLKETAERDRFHTHPEAYYRTMVETLAPSGIVQLAFAEREGEAVAAGIFARFGTRMTYVHGASRSDARRFMAPYALHWQVMRAAKVAGAEEYDFWGIAPDDSPEHPWAGITRFKVGFGGTRVAYLGTWELPDSAFWYTLYRRARNMLG